MHIYLKIFFEHELYYTSENIGDLIPIKSKTSSLKCSNKRSSAWVKLGKHQWWIQGEGREGWVRIPPTLNTCTCTLVATGSPVIFQQVGLLGIVTELRGEVIGPKTFLWSFLRQGLYRPSYQNLLDPLLSMFGQVREQFHIYHDFRGKSSSNLRR